MADGLIYGKNGQKYDSQSFAVVGGEKLTMSNYVSIDS